MTGLQEMTSEKNRARLHAFKRKLSREPFVKIQSNTNKRAQVFKTKKMASDIRYNNF